MNERKVCLGAFAGAHGVRGEVKVRTFTESAENIAAYGKLATEDGRSFSLTVLRVLKPGLVLARAAEIATREEAERLGGKKLYVDRAALPPADDGQFYIEDLVGLAAFDEAGAPLGRVAAMHNFGAGDILEVELPGKKAVFVPFSDDAAPKIDIAAGRITLRRSYVEQPSGDAEAS
jgi:16S rRNA processing protein RimM